MEKIKLIEYTFKFDYKWQCPNCKRIFEDGFNPSPYTALAEEELPVYCNECKRYYEITLYED